MHWDIADVIIIFNLILWFIIQFEKCNYSDIDYLYCISCTLICTSILIIMLTLTMSYNSHIRSPPPSLSLYSSDLVGAFICKARNYCRKCYMYTVCYFSNWYYFLLPYYNSLVTTPVHWNSHSSLHTIKLVYCNNYPHKYKLIYTKIYIVN